MTFGTDSIVVVGIVVRFVVGAAGEAVVSLFAFEFVI